MKQRLCCLVNTHARCKCGYAVCENHVEQVAHECEKRVLKEGHEWKIMTIYVKGKLREIIGQRKKLVGRKWEFGSLKGTNMDGWVPSPEAMSAKWLKFVSLRGPVKRNTFYDSAMVTNLSKKAGYVERIKGGYILTEKGRQYVKSHKININVGEWMLKNSAVGRYKVSRGYSPRGDCY